MKKRFLAACILAVLAGILQDYLYIWIPLPLVGLLAPVSGSVWEHLKLLYWPFLLAALCLTYRMREKPRAWSAFLASALLMPLTLSAAHYLLAGGFGLGGVFLDAILYALVMAGGFTLSFSLYGSGAAEDALGLLIVLTAIYGVCLIVFTLSAPNLPIFLSPAP